jgi:hypothetical protein
MPKLQFIETEIIIFGTSYKLIPFEIARSLRVETSYGMKLKPAESLAQSIGSCHAERKVTV